ncbi:MAG: hypothetical protein ACR2PZ_09260 [Pseudomonadales bacterium]
MSMIGKLFKWLLYLVLMLAVVVAVGLFAMRFADGPAEIIAGGPFKTGELHQGAEPDWSFLKDREEVEFQLLEPARSRTTWIVEHEGRIYIPSGYMNTSFGKIWKQWPLEAEKDGRAILRVDGKLYERRLLRLNEGEQLPTIVSELGRKYMGNDAGMVEGGLAQIRDGNLWIFELAPR